LLSLESKIIINPQWPKTPFIVPVRSTTTGYFDKPHPSLCPEKQVMYQEVAPLMLAYRPEREKYMRFSPIARKAL